MRALLLVFSCWATAEAQTSGNSLAATDSAEAQSSMPLVEVTGTRLRRTDIQTPSPVEVISRADIDASGKQTLSDVVRSITADNNGSISLGNVSGFAQGSSGVSLRGLAVNATLVLINGRRMTSYGLADDGQRTFVNLSTIPLDVVDRIEILKDGGSAIYGSDAIAGVVNIILRESFQGLLTNASFAVSQYGDGETPRMSVTGGLGNPGSDGYNMYLNIEASHQEAMYAGARSERKWIGSGDLRPYGYAFTAGGIGPNIGGWFENDTGVSNSNRYGAVSPASLSTPVWQQLPGCQSSITLPAGYGGCPFDRVSETGVIEPSERKLNIYLRGEMTASTAFNPYIEVGRFESDVRSPWVFGPTSANESWVDPSTNGVMNNAMLELPAAHPDNPLGVNALLTYLLTEAGSRTFEHDSVVYRVLLGTKGTLANWSYDTGVLYAHDSTERILTGFIRNSVLQAGLNGTGPYGYYRLGIHSDLNSQAFMQALSPEISSDNTSSLTLVDFKANRPLLALPGGSLGLSVGAEYRRETLDAPPPPYTATGDIIGWSYYAYRGEEKVASIFAEMDAPLTQSLELDAAGRADKVWDSETSVTPKVGLRWKPLEQLTLRATYSRGFRAPNPAERGAGNQFSGTLDLTGNGFLGIFRNLANPDLKPERSRTITAGTVLEPWRFTSFDMTFWWLERTNEINGVDPYAILAGASGWPRAQVVRDSLGDVLEVSSPFENNSRSRLRGIDFELNQRVPLGIAGSLTARLSWAYLASYEKTFTGGVTYEYAGTHGPMAVSGNTGTPKNRANLSLVWERGPAAVSAYVSFVDSFLNTDHVGADCAGSFADGSPAPTGCRIASFTTVTLRADYRPARGLELYTSVSNLFDRIAPLDPSAYINLDFDPALHLDGAVGRMFTVGIRYAL
jgi:iron complex outermembrane receptor protein